VRYPGLAWPDAVDTVRHPNTGVAAAAMKPSAETIAIEYNR